MGLMVLSGCAEGALDGFCAANVGFRLEADYDKLAPRAGTDDKAEVQANRFGAAK